MFNENDNKDDLLNKKPKEETKQSYDFTGFSHKQDEVVLNEDQLRNPTQLDKVSFHEFEESTTLDDSDNQKDKKSLKEHFRRNRGAQKQFKKQKPLQKKPKRLGRKKRKEIEDFDDIKKRRAYKFKRKKYTKVEDFIKYLNEHYLDLDEIADSILNDENFHGWLKKKSKRFDESIGDFRDIIESIEN